MSHVLGPHVMLKSGFAIMGGAASVPSVDFGQKMDLGGICAFASHYGSDKGGVPILGYPKSSQLDSWPKSVEDRWQRIHLPKSRNELALLSWNTNGRLDLRGCRESLIRCWARKGFVDIALIQETLKKSGSSLFDMFGPDWRNISSWAVGGQGRGSGGCTIFGQPSLVSTKSFMVKGGRICGSFIGDGLILNIYFLQNVVENLSLVTEMIFPPLLMSSSLWYLLGLMACVWSRG